MADMFINTGRGQLPEEPWWKQDKKKPAEVADALLKTFRFVEESDAGRITDYRMFTRIYENRDSAVGAGVAQRLRSGHRSPYNVTKQVVDAITSQVAKTRPHARFQTFGGNRSLRRKAGLLERWVRSEQYRSNMDRIQPDIFLDCCIYGTGVMKLFADGKKIVAERTRPGDLFVDSAEAEYGNPANLYQALYLDKHQLIEDFGVKEEDIQFLKQAARHDDPTRGLAHHAEERFLVTEAWHLSKKGHGRHVIASGGLTLVDEKWTKPDFPFLFIRWTKPRDGFWGIGLVEELMALHIDINLSLKRIQKSLKFGHFQVWLNSASRVQGKKLSNDIAAVNTYSGEKPSFVTPTVVAPEQLTHLMQQEARAFAQGGTSREAAQGINELGADASGISRREFHDIRTQRFSIIARQWEWFHLDAAKFFVGLGKDIASRHKDYSVVAERDRKTIDEVVWKDIDMEADTYVIQVSPVSALPSTFAGRKADVIDLYREGLIAPDEAKVLLDMPDLDEFMSLDRASANNIDRIIEQILDEGIYEAPEPFIDLQLALKKAQSAYNRALEDDDVGERELQMLRQWMQAVNLLMQRAMAAQQVPQMGGVPGVPPAPGPTGQPPTAVRPQDGPAIQ